MYQEQVPNYKHLDEPLDEGRFVFECILVGNLQAFTTCRLSSHVQETVLCICLAALVKTGPDQTENQTEVVNKDVNHLPCGSRSFGSGRYLE